MSSLDIYQLIKITNSNQQLLKELTEIEIKNRELLMLSQVYCNQIQSIQILEQLNKSSNMTFELQCSCKSLISHIQ